MTDYVESVWLYSLLPRLAGQVLPVVLVGNRPLIDSSMPKTYRPGDELGRVVVSVGRRVPTEIGLVMTPLPRMSDQWFVANTSPWHIYISASYLPTTSTVTGPSQVNLEAPVRDLGRRVVRPMLAAVVPSNLATYVQRAM